MPPTGSEIVIDLPLPTSTNRIWAHGRGRVFPSAEYKAWIKQANNVAMLTGQLKGRAQITGPFKIELLFDRNCRGDGDNRIKAALDWLQKHAKLIKNDSQCREGHWKWAETQDAPFGCRIVVTPLP